MEVAEEGTVVVEAAAPAVSEATQTAVPATTETAVAEVTETAVADAAQVVVAEVVEAAMTNRPPLARAPSATVVICRICLSTRQRMISIHSKVPEYDQKTLYAMLLSVCRPLNECETVLGLPEQICRNCKWKLLTAYDLYETTLASDEHLRAQTGEQKRMSLPRQATGGSLKRTLSQLGIGGDDQLAKRKIGFICVKKEPLEDECGDESLLQSSAMDTTEDADDGSGADPLDAFIDEHYQMDAASGSHVCGLCKQDFPYKSQCRMHIGQKHNPAKPFKCEICFCTLTSQQRLDRHQSLTHGVGNIKDEDAINAPDGANGEVTYTCPICQKVFNSSVRFKRHKSVHVAHNRPFKCDVCLYRFHTKPQLTQHAKVHEPKSPSANSPGPESSSGGVGGWYECEHCEEIFPGKRARTMHLKKAHQIYLSPGGSGQRSEEREKSEYTCIICQESFARETVLNTHMKMHELIAAEKEKEKRIDLEKLVKQELQQQMLLNVPPLPPLSPEVVDKSNHVLEPFVFGLVPVSKDGPSNRSSTNNNNTATSVNNNSSAPAGAEGPSAMLRLAGLTPKQKESPKSDIAYLCTICEREFDERELLKKHQKEVHPKLNVDIVLPQNRIAGNSRQAGGAVRFGGSRPSKLFLPRLTAKPGLNARLLNGSVRKMNKPPVENVAGSPTHDGNSPETEEDAAPGGAKTTSFMCELCHKTFSYKCYLSMHMRKNHDKSKPYGCKVCHYRFGYRGTLLRHQLMHSSQNVRPGGHGSIIFKCRICSAKFLELKQLNMHLKVHQKPTDDPNRKVQLIQCHECSQIFSDRSQFRQHMEDEHEQEMDMLLDRESPSTAYRQHSESNELRLGQLAAVQRPPGGSSSSLRNSERGSASPLTDLKLRSEPRQEDDATFLNDLSIIKIESNYE